MPETLDLEVLTILPYVGYNGSEWMGGNMRIVQKLTAREREILELRLGLGGKESLSLAEVGERLGITRERVRQLEDRAIRKLNVHRNADEPKTETLHKIPPYKSQYLTMEN